MHGDQGSGTDDPASANIRAVAHARLERLNADLRVLSPIGIERAAWDEWRRRLFEEVEGRQAFVAWRAEHGAHAAHVHKAERAAFAAALGVFAQSWISHSRYATLVSAMAEALPWLLPEQTPAPA